MDTALADSPFRDAARPVDERVDDLMSLMTLDEKIAQLGGIFPNNLVADGALDAEKEAQVLQDGIGHVSHVSAVSALPPAELAVFVNEIQRHLVEDTRLGIPAVVHGESCAGFTAVGATCFPQAIGLASTWQPELIEEMATAIRAQMRAVGVRHTLAPVLDIARDARWGRCEETYGEDPYLAGRMGVAYVRGLQGNDLAAGVVCTGKHFLGYAASEGGMNWAPAHITEREMKEVYAAPFLTAIQEAQLASVMNSYSEIDGVPVGASRKILTELLRDEMGFVGTVISDYFTVPTLQTYHNITDNRTEAAARALEAGIDLEVPALNCYRQLGEAVESGRIDMQTIDTAVTRVLRQKFELGLFEAPYVDAEAAESAFDTADHRNLARTIAQKSIVLLKNDGDLLPLSKGIQSLAVVGPCADSVRLLQGDYHWPTHAEVMFGRISENEDDEGDQPAPAMGRVANRDGSAPNLAEMFVPHVTLLEGIRKAVGSDGEVLHARGCGVVDDDTTGIAAAAAIAARADVAIVAVGTRSGLVEGSTSGESSDRSDLRLTAAQRELVESVVATGTPTVVVLINGGILALPAIAETVPAIVEAWLSGEEGGNAVADVLFGDVNPSGRLPVSLPRSVGQMPLFYNHKPSGGRTNWRTHYVDSPATPLYPFGHGLSYTSFEYSDLQLNADEVAADGTLTVSCRVTNDGQRTGDEVVQLYLHDAVASCSRPVKQLTGFARIRLEPGEGVEVAFDIDMSQLAFWNPEMEFVVEPGDVEVMIGASSEDIRLRKTFRISGEPRSLAMVGVVPTKVRVARS
jgi:beta-glucosidase